MREGTRTRAELRAFVHDEAFYASQAIDLQTSTHVDAIDADAGHVVLASGTQIAYDTLLLATGSTPRRLSVPGGDDERALSLRTAADADVLRGAIGSGTRVVVIGAGWIGYEVAASARTLGAEVTVLETGRVPLERVLGFELGAYFRDLHLTHGVSMRFGHGIDSIEHAGTDMIVRLADGTTVAGDVVVAGVGVLPRTELAADAGIDVDNGIPIDQFLRTSAPDVFAAGDVANAWHPLFGQRVRLEHWSAALNQGPLAARNMLGQELPYTEIPYFFSDQYDLGMEYAGVANGTDEVVYRGDPASGEFIAFWLRGDHVMAGMNVNVWDVSESIAALVRSAQPIDRTELADPTVELTALVQP